MRKCYLGELDGGGSSDDGVAEELGDEREQAFLVGEASMAERSHRTAHVDP